MSFVEIYKTKNDGTQEIMAICHLTDDFVVCEGNERLVKSLEDGVLDYSSDDSNKKLFFKDGLKFLEQLKYNFKSGYLNASEVKEGVDNV